MALHLLWFAFISTKVINFGDNSIGNWEFVFYICLMKHLEISFTFGEVYFCSDILILFFLSLEHLYKDKSKGIELSHYYHIRISESMGLFRCLLPFLLSNWDPQHLLHKYLIMLCIFGVFYPFLVCGALLLF